jgi:hypothetical protein
MKKGLLGILKGSFLVSDAAAKNWLFILFASGLAFLMIASSHSADRKVHKIAAMNETVRELRSEFVEARSNVQRLKLESTIRTRLEEEGLKPSETPPFKIKVLTQED